MRLWYLNDNTLSPPNSQLRQKEPPFWAHIAKKMTLPSPQFTLNRTLPLGPVIQYFFSSPQPVLTRLKSRQVWPKGRAPPFFTQSTFIGRMFYVRHGRFLSVQGSVLPFSQLLGQSPQLVRQGKTRGSCPWQYLAHETGEFLLEKQTPVQPLTPKKWLRDLS